MTVKTKKLNYTAVIIVMSALMVCVAIGFCSSSKGLFLKAITESLGISRSAFSINDSCRYISTAIINLFFGTLISKFGSKKLITAGFLCLMLSCVIYAFATSVFIIYIGGCLLGIGLSWTGTTMVGHIVNAWCTEKRGTVMGVVLASNGIGAAIATQILSPVIHSAAQGYRKAYILVTAILFAIMLLFIILYKEKPHTSENYSKKPKGNSWAGLEFNEIIRKPYFYLALVSVFLTGLVLQGCSGIATPHLYDVGLDEVFVASIVSLHALSLTLFKFLTGVMYDKFGIRITSNICMATSVVVFVLLANVTNTFTGRVFASVYEVLCSLALPLETIMLPIYAGEYFGEKAFNKVLGLFVSVNTAGYALGAPLSNLCFDITGSYNFILYCACAIMFVTIIITNYVITASKRERLK